MSCAGASDCRYVTSLQIASGGRMPPNAGMPRGRPSWIDRKIAPSDPPYRHRPSARLGPTAPTAPGE
jgi:hypothetical protein